MSKIVETKVTWQTTAENKEDSEFKLTEILVKVGDKIQEGDLIATAETEKATIDVYAPASGLVKEVFLKVNDPSDDKDVYHFGAVLCAIEV